MKRLLAVVVGFVHDFSAGLWAATLLAVWWLDRLALGSEARVEVDGLERRLFWIGVACVALVAVTGMGRTFTYVENFYGEDAERARRRALVTKHVVLLLVFGAGTLAQYRWAFR